MSKKEKQPKYILEDFSRDALTGELKDKNLKKKARPGGPFISGNVHVILPLEAHVAIDFTGPIGAASGIYYSLIFQLGKWEYLGTVKADEWIEVSPTHAAYYQITQKQKEDLEARIKSGIASAAQSVADLELLMHDKRKYEEMLHYLGYESREINGMKQIDFSVDNDAKKAKELEKRIDNHSLKAMFIDQVEIHTGEGISMRSIVQRWPTLISDFMRLDDNDTDPDKVRTKLDVSRAEAVVLVTKNKLFIEWKKIFLPDVAGRYKRITELVKSREMSVSEYRDWVKPYVARHKLITEGLSSASTRASALISPYTTSGHPTSSHQIIVWTWKDFTPPEIFKIPSELVVIKAEHVTPYDEWTKKNLIFNKQHGLIVKYPWITHEWCEKKLEEFYASKWMIENKHYYSFFIITFTRTVMRMPSGEEIEDGVFDVNLTALTQNALFVKLLELSAKQEDFNRYVDEMLGVPHPMHGGKMPEFNGEKENPVKKLFDEFNINFQLFKRGPYERDFLDRITKYYLTNMAVDRYVPIVNFIKSKMSFGN